MGREVSSGWHPRAEQLNGLAAEQRAAGGGRPRHGSLFRWHVGAQGRVMATPMTLLMSQR